MKKIITTKENSAEINAAVMKFERFSHLTLHELSGSYQTIVKKIMSEGHNGCRFLSKMHPFITATDSVIYFD